MVEELASRFDGHPNFILTSYMGSTVSDLEQVRRSLRGTASDYVVVKNSVLRVVLEKRKLDDMKAAVDGGMGISFSGNDIISACKILVNFSKTHDKFKIKTAMVDGRVMSEDALKRLASLPTKEVLLAQVVGGIKSPITGFVNTLSGILRKFVYVVDAIKAAKTSKEVAT